MPKRWNIKKYIAKHNRRKKIVPNLIAATAVAHFKRNFQLEGFVDSGISKWQKRKRENLYKYPILRKTGTLFSSLRKKVANWRIVKVGTYTVAYSRVHNRGDSGKNIPERKYIGNSIKLTRAIKKILIRSTKEVFR